MVGDDGHVADLLRLGRVDRSLGLFGFPKAEFNKGTITLKMMGQVSLRVGLGVLDLAVWEMRSYR